MRIVETLSTSTGGIGRHVADLAPRLRALGHDVTVLCPAATAAAHDLTGLDVGPPRWLASLSGIDVVHAHGYKAGAVALPWARLRRIPLVVTWHNAVLAGGAAGATGRALQVLLARGADLTLGASTDLVETARSAGARAAELGPVAAPRLGPPRVPRSRLRADLGLAPDELVVLTIGRLAPQKNLDLVLDVALRLADRSDVTFVVAGGGPLHAPLAARVAREDTRVRLVGPVDDVASLLGAADLMLLTSTWEARALVAQEALSAGLPLVATRVGGLTELVGDAAVLIEPTDADAAAEAVRALLDEPAGRATLAEAGRRRAAGWPDEDDVARQLAATYARVAGGGPARHSTKGRRST